MSKEELEVILRHEKYHLEHRDGLTLLLATVVESLFPFSRYFQILLKFTEPTEKSKLIKQQLEGLQIKITF
jgi:beta-lactamase regulating signal transducer with metallopeptidase domain